MAASDPAAEKGSEAETDTAKLQADIERTRADLADTVDALASRVSEQKQQAKTGLVRVGIAVGVGVVLLVVVKQVRARRS